MNLPVNVCMFVSLPSLPNGDAPWHRLTFAACYKFVFKIGFVLAKELGRKSGQVSAWGTIHMAAALAGCRMGLLVSDCKDEDNTKNNAISTQKKSVKMVVFECAWAPDLVHPI